MTREEKLHDIRFHPENHIHDFNGLMQCCTAEDGAIDGDLIEAHAQFVGDLYHDVISGPCSCGAWH